MSFFWIWPPISPRASCSGVLALTFLLQGCGDGIPDFTAEELADATGQVREAFHLQDHEFGCELGLKWASWAPDALELKAWTVANLAKARLSAQAVKMAEGMMETHPDSPWSAFALAGAGTWTYDFGLKEEVLRQSEVALNGLPDLIDAMSLREEALSTFLDSDSARAFLETLSEDQKSYPDLRVAVARSKWERALEPSDELVAEVLATYEGILRDHPDHLGANLDLALYKEYYADAPDESVAYLERAASLTPSPAVHSRYWQGVLSDPSLDDEEKPKKIEADVRAIVEEGGESPARWAALAKNLGYLGMVELQSELEERILNEYPNSRAEEIVLGNRFQSLARDVWEAPDLGEEGRKKSEELAAQLEDFIHRREHQDPNLLTEALWNLFILKRDEPSEDPSTLKELCNDLVEQMDEAPGPNPPAYYTAIARTLADQLDALEEARAVIDRGLAALEKDDDVAEAEDGEEVQPEEAKQEEVQPEEAKQEEAQPEEAGGEVAEEDEPVTEEGETDLSALEEAQLETQRVGFSVTEALVLMKEGRLDEAQEALEPAQDLDPEDYVALNILPFAHLNTGRLLERRAEAARAQGEAAEAEALLSSAEESYLKGIRLDYYAYPPLGIPWVNPNEPALEALYQKRHGDLAGFEDYVLAVKDEGWEERRDEILAQRIENPETLVAFALETLEGEEVDSQSLLGKVLVINFWGTW